MSVALRHRLERLEKFLRVRRLAVDRRKGSVSHLAEMFALDECQVEAIWDRIVGNRMLTPESMNVLMNELFRACNPPPNHETSQRRFA